MTASITRAINRFKLAVREHAFKGSKMPEEHAAIEKEYERAHELLLGVIKKRIFLTDREKEHLQDLLHADYNTAEVNPVLSRHIYQKIDNLGK